MAFWPAAKTHHSSKKSMIEKTRLRRRATGMLGALICVSLVAANVNSDAAKPSSPSSDGTLGGPSGVSQELESQGDYRDELLEPGSFDGLLEPWRSWKRELNQKNRIKLGLNVLMAYQPGI